MVNNPNFYDAYPIVTVDKENSKVIAEIELWYGMAGRREYAGAILREERTLHNFLETEYRNSQGMVQKRYDLADGNRVAEHYDTATGDYECYLFDHGGTLLRKEQYNQYGDYTISERQSDNSMKDTCGTTVFTKRMSEIE